MENINYYIELSKELENISDGGSKCYDVGDGKVLVCYCIDKKYNTDPRRDAEEIAFICNQKNDEGVNVPKQYEIKRMSDVTYDYCYVLQEKAKGVSFTRYTNLDRKEEKLEKQREIASLPLQSFIKCAHDMAQIMHMGFETQPKNIFFDPESKEFSFIDFLETDERSYDGSLADFLMLERLCSFTSNFSLVIDYDNPESDISKKSTELYNVIKAKTFLALKNTVYNFDVYERFLVRSYNDDLIGFLVDNKLVESDLVMNGEEISKFDSYCNQVAEESLSHIISGESELWDIEENYIRNRSDSLRLGENFRFHPQNRLDRNGDDYDFLSDSRKKVRSIISDKFYEKILEIGENSDNPNLINAYATVVERQKDNAQKK